MPKKKEEVQDDAPDAPVVETPIADAGAAVYRDKSGKSMTGNISEGRANFGAITAAALAVAETAEPADDAA